MSEHRVSLRWANQAHPKVPNTYDRNYAVDFGHGVVLTGSAAAAYAGDGEKPDPEQLLVAALSSCHMLYFLALAEGSGFKMASYEENAVGILAKGSDGTIQITEIELSPKTVFVGEKVPDAAAIARLHHRAHKSCFIANSLKTKVAVKDQDGLEIAAA